MCGCAHLMRPENALLKRLWGLFKDDLPLHAPAFGCRH